MKLRVGINGFGRIGRIIFREGFDDIEIVGINSGGTADSLAHLLKYDSTHGIYEKDVSADANHLIIDGKKIPFTSHMEPDKIPWKDWEVDIVFECTGAFKSKDEVVKHLHAGAKRVLVSAPFDPADLTVVYGVNHQSYDPALHAVVSNASCTTNCLAPVAKVLHEKFKILNGTMTTIHSYTNDQRILDAGHNDKRRARTAATSMIPTTTGAAKAVGKVLPALAGKVDGLSIRVPTPNVSLVDFTFTSESDMSIESINTALIEASKDSLKGVLACEKAPLVSVDFNGNPASSIVDLPSTMVIGSRMAKVLSWYDNEVGFSNRMIDMAKYMQSKGL